MSLIAPSVEIELDLIWALSGQQDVVGLVEHLGDQLTAIHVKDGVVPASNPFAPEAPAFDSTSLDQRHAGEGDVPTIEALKAATKVKNAVIEYDNAPGHGFGDGENTERGRMDGECARAPMPT